jgi:KUP system potassium uptake protein
MTKPQPPAPPRREPGLLALGLGALGVVYGDIGTSPLYAVRECFVGSHGVEVTPANILGVLSLIIWAILLVVVVKYLSFVLQADHQGEGGVFALMARTLPRQARDRERAARWITTAGLLGAGLLLGDGIITPAISVQSAVEGLEVATDALASMVIPITVVILIALFWIQRRGTGPIGAMFGPVMLLWFSTIGALGAAWVVRNPEVLWAFSPHHAVAFLGEHGLHGALVLGAVMLCITGGEALYADLGHFGRRPIRLAWFTVAMPALLLNYLGQGAMLLERGAAGARNPFYALVPAQLLYPMVILATVAAVIASQAMISGIFSLTRQAVQLGFLPRLQIVHTSGSMEGQIYLPTVNVALMVGCVVLVVVFGSSSRLAAAYGVSVIGVMAITSVLFFQFARQRWGLFAAILLGTLFLLVDLSFLSANLVKVPDGGWFPLAVGAALFTLTTTWKRGRMLLGERVRSLTMEPQPFLDDIARSKPHRVRGTAVFMTLNPDIIPLSLLHHFKHNQVLHEQVVLLTILTEHVPEVPPERRAQVKNLGAGFFQVVARCGFMESPNVPEILSQCKEAGLVVSAATTSFFLGRETLRVTGASRMVRWRASLFAFLSQNARPPGTYFGIPANRVVELGAQLEL